MSYYYDDAWDWCACGKRKKAAFRTCWSCKQDALQETAFNRGWDAGYAYGVHEQTALTRPAPEPELHPELLKAMLKLCHPDKHGSSELATQVTQWLNEQRARAKGSTP